MSADADWEALNGKLFLEVVCDDGSGAVVAPEVDAGGSWSFVVPEGVAGVVGWCYARPGETMTGRFEAADVERARTRTRHPVIKAEPSS